MLGRVQIQITQLERYRESLNLTLSAMQALKGTVTAIRRLVTAEVSTDESAQAPELSDNEQYQPRPVPGTDIGAGQPERAAQHARDD